jgi:hypothetical protein
MKRPLVIASAMAALIAASGAVHAGPGFDIGDTADMFEAEPVDMDLVRQRDGTLMSRESFVQPDGSVITRMTIRHVAQPVVSDSGTVELTPAQRRLIWHSVAVPTHAAVPVEIEDEFIEVPAPIAREHIEAVPGLRSYRVGTRIPSPQSLQPLPDEVMVAVPNVQNHLYAVVGERILLVDPHTNTVVAEVVR